MDWPDAGRCVKITQLFGGGYSGASTEASGWMREGEAGGAETRGGELNFR